MSWRTVVTSSRWASFGAKSTPGLPPFPNHEDPVELDDNLPSFVEAPRPDPDKSEARATPGLPDLRDLGVRVDRVSIDRKSTRLNSSHQSTSRMPSSA